MTISASPQLILRNGILATQASESPGDRAIAIGNGKILAVGPDKDVKNLAEPDTVEIDSTAA